MARNRGECTHKHTRKHKHTYTQEDVHIAQYLWEGTMRHSLFHALQMWKVQWQALACNWVRVGVVVLQRHLLSW